MDYGDLLAQLENCLNKKFSRAFYIDSTRLANCLQVEFGQDLNNITLSVETVLNIVLRKISINQYAAIYGKSYSSIIANKFKYVSLVEQKIKERSRFFLAEFEAAHFQRINHFGRLLERRIRNNDELNSELIKDTLYNKEIIVNKVIDVLKEYYYL